MRTEQIKKYGKLCGRYGIFLIGLFFASLGVTFSTKAGLGTSPVSSIPYSISLVSSLFTFGGWLNLLSILQIAVQVILLRKNCHPAEIVIQTILAFVYGYLTNFSCRLLQGLTVETYGAQLLFLTVSCFVLAFGIWVQLKADVAMLPGEAMNRAISQVTGCRYENVKIFFDIAYIAVAAAIGMCCLGRLEGVREGSIIAAIGVGSIIKLYHNIFAFITKKVVHRRPEAD